MSATNLTNQQPNDIQLSKALSWILRHNAINEGLDISMDGYLQVNDILNHKTFEGKYTVDDIKRVVQNNDKKRFSLRERCGNLEICANQGHSMKEVGNTNLIPITSLQNLELIHGTYLENWECIKTEGLNRMKRNHIHFATGLSSDKTVVSGIRKDSQVFIYINLPLALSEGLKFYKSANGVYLSPGNKNGIIETKYFSKVLDLQGKNLTY